MRRHRHAKIVATLGPASSSPEVIRALFDAGADVFRLNFSHGSREEHRRRYDVERETGQPIVVPADLQAPFDRTIRERVPAFRKRPAKTCAGDRMIVSRTAGRPKHTMLDGRVT